MSSQNHIRELLQVHSVIPVVAFDKEDDPIQFVKYLQKSGINCIEITLRTDYAYAAILDIKKHFGNDFHVGVGTVVNSLQTKEVEKMKVDFLVSPGTTENIIAAFKSTSIPFISGVATPSEIMYGIDLGLDTFKFFPANLFGGLAALKNYNALFKHLKFCPTGGISKESYKEFLAQENVMSVGGSWLQNDFKKTNNKA